MIVRIAAGLALNRAPEHRWRRVAVPASVALFMLLVFAGSSVIATTLREEERVEQRTALLASSPSPTDLILKPVLDIWGGEQYPVIWMQSTGNAAPVLPPGMSQLPAPGQAVVSPALDQLAENNPDLAARYPDRLVLGQEGIRSGDELFAYVHVQPGRTLPGDLAGELSGDTRAVRVHEFASPSDTDSVLPLEPPLSMASVAEVTGGVLGFLIVPGLIALAAGVATASGVRDHRFEVLRWVGVPRWTLATLSTLETLMLAIPSIVVVTLLWGLMAPRLEQVPLVGHEVVRGDLGLPWWLLVLELSAGVVATSLVAIVLTTVRHRRELARLRPISRRVVVTPLRATPLVIALMTFTLGRMIGGNPGATLNLAGTVATIVGIPLVLPGVLRAVGTVFHRLESVPISVASRSLEWDPIRAARPFAGGAALVVIALAGSGYLALARHVEASPPSTEETQAVFVEWLDSRSGDPVHLAEALDTGLVVPFSESESHLRGGTHEDALVVGATCRQLALYFPGMACNSKAPYKLPYAMEQRLAEMLALAAHGPSTKIQLAPPEDNVVGGSVLVLDKKPLKSLDRRVRDAAVQTLPAPTVYSWLSTVPRESPLVVWIKGGIVSAAITLMIGCLLSLIDRFLGARDHRHHLLNLGVSSRRLVALEAWLFAAPYTAVVAISFSVGLTICALMVGLSDIPMPWLGIGATLVIAIITGLVGTMSVALFGARRVRENAD